MTNVMQNHILLVSISQVYRAMKRAEQLIEETYSKKCGLLWDYHEELRKKNHGTIAIIKMELGPNGTTTVYIELKSQVRAPSRKMEA